METEASFKDPEKEFCNTNQFFSEYWGQRWSAFGGWWTAL